VIRTTLILVSLLVSGCAGARGENDWAKGCIFGIEDAARNFGVPVDHLLVQKYCVERSRGR